MPLQDLVEICYYQFVLFSAAIHHAHLHMHVLTRVIGSDLHFGSTPVIWNFYFTEPYHRVIGDRLMVFLCLQENFTQERLQWERLKLREHSNIDRENALIEKQKVRLSYSLYLH